MREGEWGEVRKGKASFQKGMEDEVRYEVKSKARQDKAWQGMAWHGKAWQGMAKKGKAWQGVARQGKAWKTWQGKTRHGMASQGKDNTIIWIEMFNSYMHTSLSSSCEEALLRSSIDLDF